MQEGKESPCSASAGNGHVGCLTVFTALPTATDDCESATVLILGLQRNFSEYASSQIRNPQIMRNQLCYEVRRANIKCRLSP